MCCKLDLCTLTLQFMYINFILEPTSCFTYVLHVVLKIRLV